MGKFGGHGLSSSKITCPPESTVLDTRECAVGIMKATHSVGKQLHLCHETSSSVWLE